MKIVSRCASCGAEHPVEVYDRINVKESPELKEKVKDGSLFMWECPHCGRMNLVCNQLLYHDSDEHVMFFLIPPGSFQKEHERALEAQGKALSESLPGYVLRRVDDTGTLLEKVNIFDSGLNDTVIEMCKHVIKMEMIEKGDSKDILDALFKFYRIDGPDNDLVFSYPHGGAMQVLRTGFNVYEDCAGIIRRNPSVKPSAGFARIDSDWVSRFFR
jgi:hypothetical protein